MPLEILIPAAGLGRRMKSYGPKALLQVNGETVIARQIRLLREAFPGARVTVVAGFEAHRVKNAVPSDVQIVLNPEYEESNVSHSIALGLSSIPYGRTILVVYGDLVFTPEALSGIDLSKSGVVVDTSGSRPEEVGLTAVEGSVTYFSYGLPTKWSHVAVLKPEERHLFSAIAIAAHRRKHFGYEILNEVIERGGTFAAFPMLGKLVEIDSSKDLARAREIDSKPIDALQSQRTIPPCEQSNGSSLKR